MLLIDSHCHLADARLSGDIDDVIARSRAAGVTEWVVPTAQSCEWTALNDLVRRFEGMHPAYGIHPWYCENHNDSDLQHLRDRLAGAVALGECGLDFGPGRAPEVMQIQWLHRQLEIAAETHLPVILHSYKSLDRLTQELKAYPNLRGVLHGFTGSRQQADRLIDLGYFLGIGTRIVRPEARRLRDIVRLLPVERICIETDAPDQPVPSMRGGRNEPAALNEVLDTLAELRQTSRAELASQCNKNTRELYRL